LFAEIVEAIGLYPILKIKQMIRLTRIGLATIEIYRKSGKVPL
jgi:hypothetical protein